MNKTLSQVSQTVRQQPVKIEIGILPVSNMHAWLQKLRLKRRTLIVQIRPATIGKLYHISEHLLTIKGFSIDQIQHTGFALSTAKENLKTLAFIIAILITKNRLPSKKLIAFVERNFEIHHLELVSSIVFDQMNLTGFIRTIVLLRGLEILNTSPTDQVEKIAPGTL